SLKSLRKFIVKRIFLVLMICCFFSLTAALLLGLNIGDPALRSTQGKVSLHMLTGLSALIFNVLLHAIVLTYFMGTSRWLEETSLAYELPMTQFAESRRMKLQVISAMSFCILLLIITGGFGGAADPASTVGFKGWFGLSPGTIHMAVALITWMINLCTNLWEYLAIARNGELVHQVLTEVKRIRLEHGLEV
ncbi:MAG: hypothetical protein U0903_13245, partial [Planctomycetales bacterium]